MSVVRWLARHMTKIVDALAEPRELLTRAQAMSAACIPRCAGFYGWYFREVPSDVPTDGCVTCNGATLLYVGIAPRSPSSRSNLRVRLRQHMGGNASGSTVRLSLGCLMARQLGLELRLTDSGRRPTFGPGEAALSTWLEQSARVVVHAVAAPWQFEADVVRALSLPLNLEHNTGHPFRTVLSSLRREARQRARELPP